MTGGIILERIRKIMERYGERDKDKIYVHMLEKNVWFWEREERKEINEYMMVGELVHQALPRVLEPAEAKCREIYLPPGWHNIDKKIWRRYVKYDKEKRRFYVLLCGSADAMDGPHPVELKTTRRNGKEPRWEWELRARLYAWLYESYSILVILNLINGEEWDIYYQPLSDEEVQRIILAWLKNEFPHRGSSLYNNNRRRGREKAAKRG